MDQECGDTPKDEREPPRDDQDYPKPPPTGEDDGPAEDITYRDAVVEVNITSDFEGEITMKEATKQAVDDLKKACDAYLGDPSKSGELKQAIARVGQTEELGGGATALAAAPTQHAPAPGGGGDRPPFVTVNVNVTQPG